MRRLSSRTSIFLRKSRLEYFAFLKSIMKIFLLFTNEFCKYFNFREDRLPLKNFSWRKLKGGSISTHSDGMHEFIEITFRKSNKK